MVTGSWLVGAMMGRGPYCSSPVSYRLEMPMETEILSRCVVLCVIFGVCFYVLLLYVLYYNIIETLLSLECL